VRFLAKQEEDARAQDQLRAEKKLAGEATTAGDQDPPPDAWARTKPAHSSQARGSQEAPARPPHIFNGRPDLELTGQNGQLEAERALARICITEAATMRMQVDAKRSHREKLGAEANAPGIPEDDRKFLLAQWDQASEAHLQKKQDQRSLESGHQQKEKDLRAVFAEDPGLPTDEVLAKRSDFVRKQQEEEAEAYLARRTWEAEVARAASTEDDEQEERAKLKAARTASLLAKSMEAQEAAANLLKLHEEIAVEEETARRIDAHARRQHLVGSPVQGTGVQTAAPAQPHAQAPLAAPPGAHYPDPRSTE
jgi:hypothetical protein